MDRVIDVPMGRETDVKRYLDVRKRFQGGQSIKCPTIDGLLLSPPRSTAPGDGMIRLGALVTRPARRAFGPGFGLIDLDAATAHVGAVEALNGRIGLGVVVHLDEPEAFRLAGKLVCD